MKYLCLLVLSLSPAGLGAEPPLAQIELRLVDHFGQAVSRWESLSVKDAKGREWKTAFDANLTAKLPQGEYKVQILVLKPVEMKPYSITVVARAPRVSYVLGLEAYLPEGALPTARVSANLTAMDSRKGQCFLSGLFSPFQYFAGVQSSGQVVFDNIRMGSYVFTCQPMSLLSHPHILDVQDTAPLELDLK